MGKIRDNGCQLGSMVAWLPVRDNALQMLFSRTSSPIHAGTGLSPVIHGNNIEHC